MLKCIFFSINKKKQDKLQISKDEEELKRLEKEYWENPNDTCLARLVKAKYELNTIFTKKAEYSLYRLKQKWYESGDKASKLLASQLKAREAARQRLETKMGIWSPISKK